MGTTGECLFTLPVMRGQRINNYFSYHASVSHDNMFNMDIFSPSDAQGMMILLISPTFYGAASCTIFQKRVANNQWWIFLNELQHVARRG